MNESKIETTKVVAQLQTFRVGNEIMLDDEVAGRQAARLIEELQRQVEKLHGFIQVMRCAIKPLGRGAEHAWLGGLEKIHRKNLDAAEMALDEWSEAVMGTMWYTVEALEKELERRNKK